jgi:hypothetical protein
MEISKIDVSRGWGLFGRGWNAFKGDPVTWILMLIIFMVISVVLNLIPFLGGLIMAVVSPGLVAGFLKLAQDVEAGGKGSVGTLFAPLQDRERRTPLLLLGLVALAASVLMVIVMAILLGGAMALGGGLPESGAVPMPISGIGIFGMLVMFVLYLGIFAVLAFSIPLVYFRGAHIGDAIKASISGTLSNLGPLIVFSLIYFVLAIIAMIPFGLGFLVLGPVVFGALYGMYREIFPEPEEPVVVVEAESV